MRTLTVVVTFFALCIGVPVTSANPQTLAQPSVANLNHYAAFNYRGDQKQQRRAYAPHQYFPPYPAFNAGYGNHERHRADRRHQRYYGLHSYHAPAWRFPHGLRYHFYAY